MEIFINSTYAQSMSGYRIMWLAGDYRFYDVQSIDMLGKDLYDFFSEDLFKFIWYDRSGEYSGTGFSFIGVKALQGMFNNGKLGTVNIAVKLAGQETRAAGSLASAILNYFSECTDMLFRCMKVDDEGNYAFALDRFMSELRSLPQSQTPWFVNAAPQPDTLHAAVCIGSQERAFYKLSQLNVRYNTKNVIDSISFDNFIKR